MQSIVAFHRPPYFIPGRTVAAVGTRSGLARTTKSNVAQNNSNRQRLVKPSMGLKQIAWLTLLLSGPLKKLYKTIIIILFHW